MKCSFKWHSEQACWEYGEMKILIRLSSFSIEHKDNLKVGMFSVISAIFSVFKKQLWESCIPTYWTLYWYPNC